MTTRTLMFLILVSIWPSLAAAHEAPVSNFGRQGAGVLSGEVAFVAASVKSEGQKRTTSSSQWRPTVAYFVVDGLALSLTLAWGTETVAAGGSESSFSILDPAFGVAYYFPVGPTSFLGLGAEGGAMSTSAKHNGRDLGGDISGTRVALVFSVAFPIGSGGLVELGLYARSSSLMMDRLDDTGFGEDRYERSEETTSELGFRTKLGLVF